MKFGMRKPSLKKSIKAKTTGKWKRQINKSNIYWYSSGKPEEGGRKNAGA